ncbi:MAG: PPK2 family polyphosphate kinase [bacterium]
MRLKPVSGDRPIRLRDGDARVSSPFESKHVLEDAIATETDRIGALQRIFYADARHALLIVLQGRDASGKDGTIRRVFSAVNPQGCEVTSFVRPTDLELRHDYLWRVHQRVPARRMIGIFNRSHYEDVIVPRVHGDIRRKEWLIRYEEINAFERMLASNGVVILKFMLHVSRDEQKRRLEDRLTDKSKNWKFQAGDLDDRALWPAFTKAYHGVLQHTSTKWAPWYIVPGDDKPVRDWLVARQIADTLGHLDLRYPTADPSVVGLKVE